MALRADDVDLRRDQLLVARFQSGDQSAFDDLYRCYFDRLQRFCLRRVRDPHEAEEVAQEAFTRALRAMPGFAGERRFYPWLTVIASRLCVDAHRRHGRLTLVPDLDAGVVDADHSDVFDAVDRDHLAAAMARLAPRHREVLALREGEGWSYNRIADHYGVTLGTVEALLHRARLALRREFTAIAGDGPRWAALPGLGWLARRLDGLRVRLVELGDLASPMATTVASAALAMGTVGVLGAGALGPDDAPWSAATRARPVAVTTLSAVVGKGAAAWVPTHPLSRAVVERGSTPPPSSGAGLSTTRVRTGYREAEEFNRRAPVGVAVGTVSVGADPEALVTDIQSDVDAVRRSLP